MKYKERDALVASLKELTEFLESPAGLEIPNLHLTSYQGIYAGSWRSDEGKWVDDTEGAKATMVRTVKALAKSGTVRKEYGNVSDVFRVERDFGKINVVFTTDRKNVCTPKVVGHKTEPIREYVDTGLVRTVDVVEWDCTPLLK